MATKKLNAREVMADIKAGMDDSGLMEKYHLSEKALKSLFSKLVQAGLLTQADVDSREAAPDLNLSWAWECPACGKPQPQPVEECPDCGVIVAKILHKSLPSPQQQASETDQTSDSPSHPPKRKPRIPTIGIVCGILGTLILPVTFASYDAPFIALFLYFAAGLIVIGATSQKPAPAKPPVALPDHFLKLAAPLRELALDLAWPFASRGAKALAYLARSRVSSTIPYVVKIALTVACAVCLLIGLSLNLYGLSQPVFITYQAASGAFKEGDRPTDQLDMGKVKAELAKRRTSRERAELSLIEDAYILIQNGFTEAEALAIVFPEYTSDAHERILTMWKNSGLWPKVVPRQEKQQHNPDLTHVRFNGEAFFGAMLFYAFALGLSAGVPAQRANESPAPTPDFPMLTELARKYVCSESFSWVQAMSESAYRQALVEANIAPSVTFLILSHDPQSRFAGMPPKKIEATYILSNGNLAIVSNIWIDIYSTSYSLVHKDLPDYYLSEATGWKVEEFYYRDVVELEYTATGQREEKAAEERQDLAPEGRLVMVLVNGSRKEYASTRATAKQFVQVARNRVRSFKPETVD